MEAQRPEPPQPEHPEPWMRGVIPGLDPVIGHLLRASEHIKEDLEKALAHLTAEQIWAKPNGMTSAGFHAKHLAGSTARLCTYLEDKQLNAAQLAAMNEEGRGDEPAEALIASVRRSLGRYEQLVQTLTPATFGERREIGRQRLPTTAISLAIHIAEHGHRHVGQLITTAKLVRGELV